MNAMVLRRFVSSLLVIAVGIFAATASSAQNHFTECVSGTGSTATLVLPVSAEITAAGRALAEGDEVAAVTSSGECAGVVVWTGENAALTVWGDDTLEPGTHGFVGGEPIVLKVWSQDAGALVAGHVAFRDDEAHLQGEGLFVQGGIYVVEQLRAEAGAEVNPDVTLSNEDEQVAFFRLDQNYPNPFHDSTVINYHLREPGHVELEVLNVQGQRVRQLEARHQSAGRHKATLQAGDLPGGLYLVRLTSGAQTQVRRVVLAR